MLSGRKQLDLARSPRKDVAVLYALADHLDATLAKSEDLQREQLNVAQQAPGDGHEAIVRRAMAVSHFARSVRALELGITQRLLQARQRAEQVRHMDPRFAPILGLMIGGTAPLADAAGTEGGLGDISRTSLSNGPAVLQFLISRAMVEPTTASLAGISRLAVTDDYLLAGLIHFGTLLDMVAQTLETFDLAFDLYAERRPGLSAG